MARKPRKPCGHVTSARQKARALALARHACTIYIYAITLLDPPKKYDRIKGITRIGQTADHMGMGQVATLARRRRQYEELRNTSKISMLAKEIGWDCFSGMEVLEIIKVDAMSAHQSLNARREELPRVLCHGQGDVREIHWIAQKGTWRGLDVDHPEEQTLNEQKGGQGDEWARIEAQVRSEDLQAKEACAHNPRRRNCPTCCSNPKSCDYEGCGSVFASSSSLAAHKRTHTGEKPFACDYVGCSARCTTASDLTVHKRTHTGEKPFSCTVCTTSFTHSHSRKQHELKCVPCQVPCWVP